MSNLSRTIIVAACMGGISSVGCATPTVFSDVRAIDVTLIPREGDPQPAKSVDAQAIGPWADCLAKTRTISVDEAHKEVLLEGEYRLDVTDSHGPRQFVLHNTSDLTDAAGTFFRSECVHALVTAFLGTATPAP